MTLTIELPDALTRQFSEREIPEEEIRTVALAPLELWLAQPSSATDGPFTESAVPFVRKLITDNRALFEALAQR